MKFHLSKFNSLGLKPRVARKINRKLGISGRSKWIRQFKRSLNPRSLIASPSPVSADTVGYQYSGRTLSQLTGGV